MSSPGDTPRLTAAECGLSRLSILMPLLDEGSDRGGIRRPPDRPMWVRQPPTRRRQLWADHEDPNVEAPFWAV